MKIKRFLAPDMRAAFAMVRQEHGPDAVILSNRMVDGGVEIVAATNYDESLVQRTLEGMRSQGQAAVTNAVVKPPGAVGERIPFASGAKQMHVAKPQSPSEAAAAYFHPRRNTATVATTPEPLPDSFAASLASVAASVQTVPARSDAAAITRDPTAAPPAPLRYQRDEQLATAVLPPVSREPALSVVPGNGAASRQTDQQLEQMRAELASMREMIEREMHRLTDERLRGSPARAQALELMDDYGFDAGITRDVALQIPADAELHRARGLMLGLLSRRLPILAVDPIEQGGVIALVGPTGAGKTTTIAKLAATFAARHNARDVALVTTDTVRVGGREQLHSYGRQLGIAVHEADGQASLAATLERLRDYKLVLVDTAGLGQRDKGLVAQLNWLHAAGQVHTLLVLPANSHYSDLDEVVRRFSGARPQGVVLTKVDETGRLGSALSVVVDHQLPMAWITDGQRVPEDLHRAQGANLVLRLDQLRRDADLPAVNGAVHVA